MAKGIDANVDCSAQAHCIKAAGFDFVGRYYKFVTHSHPLTRSEALALSAAGLYVVAVYENGSPTQSGYFSHTRGLQDGKRAYEYARDTIRQPEGAAIYFAVDYDASAAEVKGVITAYFHGLTEAFAAAGGSNPAYPIGVYGSGSTCSWLLRHTTATYTWLAMSRGWSGSRNFEGWNLKQRVATAPVCGISVDLDESNGHGGGFKVKS
jgi:Rv2525c-like, glycoside hydrolase-like domain